MNPRYLLAGLLLIGSACQKDAGTPTPGTGTGGSLARFTIANDFLYVVKADGLTAYNLANPNDPQKTQDTPLNFGVETIFPYRNNLFIGTQTGMYIFGLANPAQPQQLSFFQHVQRCDPVVAQGNFAYVTLRGGSGCRFGGPSTLDIIDISNLSQPRVLRTYPMQSPHGLGVDGELLFVTEGDQGLKVMDISNPLDAKLIKFFTDVRAFDVIPLRNTLLVTAKNGLFQYRYREAVTAPDGTVTPPAIALISKLPIE